MCEEKGGGGEMGGLCRTGGVSSGRCLKRRREEMGGGGGVGVAQGGGQCQWLRETVVCVCEGWGGGGAQGKRVDAVRDGGAEQKNCRSKAKVSKVEPGLHLNR